MDKEKELISLEPQIIQFGADNKQLIKVTNRTNQLIQNCFFCLFNTNKYQFIPDTFALQPLQSKIINVVLKLRITDGPPKQFAYLKSKNINKRLTLINSLQEHHSYSDEKFRSPISGGTDQLNTLTSRDYRQTQKTAYQKVIAQKQAYIKKLQRKLQQQQEPSTPLSKNKQQSHQLRIQLLTKQNQSLIKQNNQIKQKFKQYRVLMQSDSRIAQLNIKLNQSMKQNDAHAEEIKYLQSQCQLFLKRVQEKQIKIKENQLMYVSKIDEIIKESQKKMQEMEDKIKEQRKNSQNINKILLAQKNEKYQKQIKSLQEKLSSRQKQQKSLQQKLQQLTKSQKELQGQRKKATKISLQKQSLQQKNKQLRQKLDKMEKSYQDLKQQTIIYKNKLQDEDNSQTKLGQYLQMALESCKNQNQILKKSKNDVQKNLNEQIKSSKYYEGKLQNLQIHIKDLSKKLKELQQQKRQLAQKKLLQQQLSHDKIMSLKSQNINLLQKITLERNKEAEKQKQLQQFNIRIIKYENQLEKQCQETKNRQNQIKRLQSKLRQAELALQQTLESKERLQKRIQKYRKQAKKSIKSISDNAKDQLKRIQQQKNQLQRKVQQLQQISASHTDTKQYGQDFGQQSRNKTRTYYEFSSPKFPQLATLTRPPMSLEGDQKRKIGIKNQKKQLQDSHVRSNKSQVDMDKVYGQLGQLREFKRYVNLQIKKLRDMLGIMQTTDQSCFNQCGDNSASNIFNLISFFKALEQSIQSKFINRDKYREAQKQIQFLKGRLSQLQPLIESLKSRQIKPQDSQTVSLDKQVDRSAIQYIRQQMKNQYKKLYDALKLSQDRYQILRNKIYTEYRSRIIDLFSKRDKDQQNIARIQAILERFVQGLGNTSHKEAVLAKQIKLKQDARRQVSILRQKLTSITKQLQNKENKKNMNCVRQPLKLINIQNETDWLGNVKTQAKMLTYEAQNARLIQQKSDYLQKSQELRDQLTLTQKDLQLKDQQIDKLRKQIIVISKETQSQLIKQQQQVEILRKKFSVMQKLQKQVSDLSIKQKQNTHLRQQLNQKRQALKSLKQRQRMLEKLLDQTKRSEQTYKDKQRKEYLEQSRIQQSLRELRQNNKDLRAQNSKLKEKMQSLIEQINKKNAAIKRMKSQGQQYRIKNVKTEQDSVQKLRLQIKQLRQQLKKTKQDLDKSKRRKQKELNEKQAQIDKIKSETSIQRSSLESIVRSLTDVLKGIYCSLDIIVRKKGKVITQQSNLEQMIANLAQIKSTKVRQFFDNAIQTLKD